MTDVTSAKQSMRREMQAVRLGLPDRAERSERICAALIDLVRHHNPKLIMAYESVLGEPDLASFVMWCDRHGITVVAPAPAPTAQRPVEPSLVDIVVVPGLAFTPGGHRLGRGGGWYDRFLAQIRPDCISVGVGFESQVTTEIPVEPHDVLLDRVVTDADGRELST